MSGCVLLYTATQILKNNMIMFGGKMHLWSVSLSWHCRLNHPNMALKLNGSAQQMLFDFQSHSKTCGCGQSQITSKYRRGHFYWLLCIAYFWGCYKSIGCQMTSISYFINQKKVTFARFCAVHRNILGWENSSHAFFSTNVVLRYSLCYSSSNPKTCNDPLQRAKTS